MIFIIDEINTRPFFASDFVREKQVIALIHQLAREFWFYETKFPLNYIGYYYHEKRWLPNYKNVMTLTVSTSTKTDLQDLGFKKLLIVPPWLDVTPLSNVKKKEYSPTAVFIGRLKKSKLPHHALQAFSIIKREIHDAKMWIIGDRYLLNKLKSSSLNFINVGLVSLLV